MTRILFVAVAAMICTACGFIIGIHVAGNLLVTSLAKLSRSQWEVVKQQVEDKRAD